MKRLPLKKTFVVVLLLFIIVAVYLFVIPKPRIDYISQVKPILNKKCITCHGGVKAKAGFSVLFREEAMAKTESGKPAIIPGDPEHSEMIRRISLKDPEERMPYKHEPLSKEEIDILTRWVKEGAVWGDHWAYLPVKDAEIPEIKDDWVKNDIDRFILSKQKEEKLGHSAEADKQTLLRRVSLDLIGVLPSQKLSDKFLKSNDAKAYEMLVDSLLASPLYGERWTSMWLDIARYADTKGYEADMGRNIWRYRDWVINAFNKDMPYDRFLTEQIAGDLLPNPTDAQYIATSFHRNTMTNDEGGTNNEEFRTAAVLDRVNTTWEALMGTTFACVQCHSHPYDPFKHDEYYKFMAYFNNSRDEDIQGEYPVLRILNDTSKQQVAALTSWVKQYASEPDAKNMNLLLRTLQPAIYASNTDSLKNAVIDGNNGPLLLRINGSARLKHVDMQGRSQLIWRYTSEKNGGVMKIRLDSPDGPVVVAANVKKVDNWVTAMINFPPQSGTHDIYVTYSNPSLAGSNDIMVHFDWFTFTKQLPGAGQPGFEKTNELYTHLVTEDEEGIPVMVENPSGMHRVSNVFERGNWRNKGKQVEPAVPNSLSFAMPANAPRNRMGLAMWLTDKRNPLVSRTIVNRLWEQLFGGGIVETLEDMGTQGIPPTHKELLDHLSWKFMNSDHWSIKTMLKEMVMSATYRQDSKTSAELVQKDQFNKFYARGPRVRLSAEQLRDQHLCISGMLSKKMYGPGVMPWQPDGIWLSPYNGAKWESDKGEDQYRRAIYTYWKRTAPYPSMISFDGAQRVVCNARRIRTNTPLQALVTLNDSVYIDMARHFARRMQKEGGNTIQQQVSRGYELMLYKQIPSPKLQVFVDLYGKALDEFKNNPDKVCEMMGALDKNNNAETAALVVVANSLLNLDEVVMKN